MLNPTFIDFEETSSSCSVQAVHFFLCFSLVTINWQTSYDSGIVRQGYRIIRGLPTTHTWFAGWVTHE